MKNKDGESYFISDSIRANKNNISFYDSHKYSFHPIFAAAVLSCVSDQQIAVAATDRQKVSYFIASYDLCYKKIAPQFIARPRLSKLNHFCSISFTGVLCTAGREGQHTKSLNMFSLM